MTYFATFNPDGTRITSYVDTVHTDIPKEAIQITDADQELYCTGNYVRDMSTGNSTSGTPILIVLTPAQQQALLQLQYTDAVQTLLDTTAQTQNYDSMLSLTSYINSTNATFKAQALAGIAWRDAVWTEGYSILDQVKAGTMVAPTLPAFLGDLPAMVWPTV
jgi:hypothetical protein